MLGSRKNGSHMCVRATTYKMVINNLSVLTSTYKPGDVCVKDIKV